IVGGTMVDSSVAGTYVITYDVSDSNGNPAVQQTRTVNVNDFTAPVITLNGDSSINIALGSVYNDAGASASDNIDGDISASIIQSGAVDTGTIGSYTLVYNVSDAAGNDAIPVTRTVNVADASGPVITLIGNNPIDHEVNTIFTDPGATALDNVDGDVSSNIGVSGTVNAAVVGSYVLSYNVNDSSGNPANTVNRTVNVQDTGAPSITVLGSSPLNHELNTPYTDAGATANDALDGDLSAGIIVGGTMVDSSVAGTYIITYDVSDSNGNPAPQQTRTVNVNDFTDPVITLIGDSFVSVDIDSIYTDAGASASDNIDGDISSNIIPSGFVDTSTPGSYTLNYDVSDAAGNAAATVSRTVNVSDSSGPTITLIGGDTIEHQQGTIFNDPGASAFDAVDGDVSSNISITGFVNASVAGSYALTYNVSDSQGNPATPVTRTVNVADSLPPVITLIGDNPLHVELNGSFTELGATASDSVDGDLSSAIIISGDAVNTSIAGTYITRYNVSDNTGNSAIEVTRTVLVSDTTIPVISLLGSNPMSIALGSIFSDPGATASDNIDGNISTSIIPSGSVDPTTLGSYTLSYDVSDSAGNAALTVTRVVNVEDNSAPLISLLGDNPMDISLGGSYNEAGATATDNVDGDLTSSIAINGSVDTDTPGTYTISYSVSDSEGNVGNATRQVNVIDNTSSDTVPPVISLLGNNPILIELGGTYFEPGATAVDGVDGDLSASIAISGFVATNAVGSYQVTYNVSDLSGNAALTVTRTVIVQDTTAPVISLLGSDPSYHEQGTTYIDAGATASDFGSDISSSIFVSGDVNENIAGTYTLSYDVADAQGNDATTVTRTVHVVDTTPPSISVLGDNPVEVIQGHVYSDLGVSATDNIDGDISSNVSIDTSGLDMSTPGSYQVHFNVTDAAGNSALTQTRTVTVIPLVKTFSASPGLDAGSSSNSTSMTISDDRQLADLNVMIDISHGRPGDLILTLTSPAGTSVVIMDRPGTTGGWFDFGCANDDVDATFDDQGSSAVENVCNSSPGIGGTVIPHNALSAFNGESTQGVWTLKVEDKATITNSGTLNTWALETIIQ
ncbi:immunoglobulin-like domain-containing protein, partial [Oleiphilus sp. HI0123]|uniref:immunoglobulin-like domain-containing protein n=2 Tax=unclassified Oleiphilus TaxID=2631174 RepID=UPI000A4256CD